MSSAWHRFDRKNEKDTVKIQSHTYVTHFITFVLLSAASKSKNCFQCNNSKQEMMTFRWSSSVSAGAAVSDVLLLFWLLLCLLRPSTQQLVINVKNQVNYCLIPVRLMSSSLLSFIIIVTGWRCIARNTNKQSD